MPALPSISVAPLPALLASTSPIQKPLSSRSLTWGCIIIAQLLCVRLCTKDHQLRAAPLALGTRALQGLAQDHTASDSPSLKPWSEGNLPAQGQKKQRLQKSSLT